jgi:hypothetical protein
MERTLIHLNINKNKYHLLEDKQNTTVYCQTFMISSHLVFTDT